MRWHAGTRRILLVIFQNLNELIIVQIQAGTPPHFNPSAHSNPSANELFGLGGCAPPSPFGGEPNAKVSVAIQAKIINSLASKVRRPRDPAFDGLKCIAKLCKLPGIAGITILKDAARPMPLLVKAGKAL
jgi:hypothetical protein